MYVSTRGNIDVQTASQAVAWGMVPGGGLFVPSEIPSIRWEELKGLSYQALAQFIMEKYLSDFSAEDICNAASAYNKEAFEGEDPAPLVNVGNMGILELWHGPTSAFKDMALQVLPRLLRASLNHLNEQSKVLILVATSGDTGKAALEGFKDVPGTEIMVLYPKGGVSAVQERQMTTTGGSNTYVVAVEGNFDHCQTAAKKCFASDELKGMLKEHGRIFSSANSINWGRLLPQIVYYCWAYLKAVEQGKVRENEPINIVVPTGNFGNILAAYYAQQMGIPIKKLICASNRNNVLADFFITGEYNINREFYQTISPSMDILISSNFERFLFEMSGRDGEKISYWYKELSDQGKFSVDGETLKACRRTMYAGWADEEETKEMIKQIYAEFNYVVDPHTAVGVKVYKNYLIKTQDQTYTIIASTASPFKFASTVLESIAPHKAVENEWQALTALSACTGWEIPKGLKDLNRLPEVLTGVCSPDEVPKMIKKHVLKI